MSRLFVCILFAALNEPLAHGEQLCQKLTLKNGKIRAKSAVVADNAKCPKGFTLLLSQGQVSILRGPAAQGETGPAGPAGADGSLRVYGDGSAGPLDIASATQWNITGPSGNNLQFTSCVIRAGATLTVPSGTTIRCLESATIAGTINVAQGSSGGRFRIAVSGMPGDTVLDFAESPPGAGSYVSSAALHGMRGPSTVNRQGGFGGGSVLGSNTQLINLATTGLFGGGGGAGTLTANGGAGGGALRVFARNGITIDATGAITANGSDGFKGSGGGGGGAITLASRSFITNLGTISAKGGKGGDAGQDVDLSFSFGGGGGGSGGVVVLASPSNTPGTVSVIAGVQGASASVSNFTGMGGGGGGASGGIGGFGGNIGANSTTANGGLSGSDGKIAQISADPTGML